MNYKALSDTFSETFDHVPIRWRLISILLMIAALQSCRTPESVVTPDPDIVDPDVRSIRGSVNLLLDEIYATGNPTALPPGVWVERIDIDDENRIIDIYFNSRLSYVPMRKPVTEELYRMLNDQLARKYRNYTVTLYSLDEPVENLIPNIYRGSEDVYDRQRMPYADERRPRPVVHRDDRHFVPQQGLEGRQIALWHSHGWYYNQQKKRWEWQRPRLFQTVEDLLSMSFTIPYLIPMLENAGAYVWIPRERDLQSNEVIVDFDSSSGNSRVITRGNRTDGVDQEGGVTDEAVRVETGEETEVAAPPTPNDEWLAGGPGVAIGSPPYKEGVNPFQQGSYRYHTSSGDGEAYVQWVPDIPEKGEYAVYISYVSLERSADDAYYSVYHRGGRADFTVNQTIGGGTWVYLGHFEFEEGVNPEQGRVELSNYSRRRSVITADAVRFGGGMGNIEREGQTGGRPRYLEAARYYMQYAGMPDSLVYGLSEGESDIIDDYQGRGEWVNYLKGAPYGPNKDRRTAGLGVPVDLSMAFHTDAGITRNDTTVGTLLIYSIEDLDSLRNYPDLISRLANRDFADILQTEIVGGIRSTWDPAWNRRHLLNSMYSEALRPNVPAVLLELLSHQNFTDMQFALDPRFRFDVSRMIYKAMLKFVADRYRLDYVVQPLPVSHFRAIPRGSTKVLLRWKPVSDSLEATADPDRYIVYTKKGDGPFDNGRPVDQPEIVIRDLDPGEIYRFKVVAVNDGGKSFPSETLAVSMPGSPADAPRRPVLIVNGFERISGPAIVDETEFRGFTGFFDGGVPDRYDIQFTGNQFDFHPDSEWRSNDAPGHGASYADFETRVVPGNSFDFPVVYGEALTALGVPFVSASVASVRDRQVDMNDFDAVILILGNQKTTLWPKHRHVGRDPEFQVFPLRLRQEIERYLALGGRMFISGAYVGTDAVDRVHDDPEALAFIRETLRFTHETNHAVRTGHVRSVSDSLLPAGTRFMFNTTYHPDIYTVDAPDAIEPYGQLRRAGENGYAVEDDFPETEVDRREAETGTFRNRLTPSGPETLIRYEENHFSAGVGFRTDHHAVVTFGFPFETIVDASERQEVLAGILKYLGIL
ncbi:MAG: fibronectin type III domain-containing protein [Balneolales bacterium]